MKNNKLNLILHFLMVILALYVIYLRFIRFLLADNESIAMVMLNPQQLPTAQPVLFSGLMLFFIVILLGLLRLKPSSGFIFRTMKGLFGYSFVFLLLQFLIVTGREQFPKSLTEPVYESEHLFVEIQASDTRLRVEPSLKSDVIMTVESGTLFLLNDVKKVANLTWNRVLLAPQKHAWIIRKAPENNGKSKRLSKTNKFYFTVADQYSFVMAVVGFIFGFLSYKRKQ